MTPNQNWNVFLYVLRHIYNKKKVIRHVFTLHPEFLKFILHFISLHVTLVHKSQLDLFNTLQGMCNICSLSLSQDIACDPTFTGTGRMYRIQSLAIAKTPECTPGHLAQSRVHDAVAHVIDPNTVRSLTLSKVFIPFTLSYLKNLKTLKLTNVKNLRELKGGCLPLLEELTINTSRHVSTEFIVLDNPLLTSLHVQTFNQSIVYAACVMPAMEYVWLSGQVYHESLLLWYCRHARFLRTVAIKSIEDLSEFTRLEYLNIAGSTVADISTLCKYPFFPKLLKLNISETRVRLIDTLVYHENNIECIIINMAFCLRYKHLLHRVYPKPGQMYYLSFHNDSVTIDSFFDVEIDDSEMITNDDYLHLHNTKIKTFLTLSNF